MYKQISEVPDELIPEELKHLCYILDSYNYDIPHTPQQYRETKERIKQLSEETLTQLNN